MVKQRQGILKKKVKEKGEKIWKKYEKSNGYFKFQTKFLAEMACVEDSWLKW